MKMTSVDELAMEPIVLKSLRVNNFRSLHDIHLRLGPGITVLAGPNASGKSNIAGALGFVVESLYDGVERAIGSRGTEAILHRHRGSGSPSFVIGLDLESPRFTVSHKFEVNIQSDGGVRISKERIAGEYATPRSHEFEFLLEDGSFKEAANPLILAILADLGYPTDSLMLSVMGDSIMVAGMLASTVRAGLPGEHRMTAEAIVAASNFIGDVRYYRLFPNDMREPKRFQVRDKLLEDGSNLASVLSRITRERGTRYLELLAPMKQALPDVLDIRVFEASGYQFIQLKHESLSPSSDGEDGWLNISEESDGTVRMLGLLVALYQNPQPTLTIIEEPENSIHVGALGILADSLKDAGQRSQVIVTTHSPDLLDYFSEENIRAVVNEEGRTRVGRLRENQAGALRAALFSAGDLHRMEGLSICEEE